MATRGAAAAVKRLERLAHATGTAVQHPRAHAAAAANPHAAAGASGVLEGRRAALAAAIGGVLSLMMLLSSHSQAPHLETKVLPGQLEAEAARAATYRAAPELAAAAAAAAAADVEDMENDLDAPEADDDAPAAEAHAVRGVAEDAAAGAEEAGEDAGDGAAAAPTRPVGGVVASAGSGSARPARRSRPSRGGASRASSASAASLDASADEDGPMGFAGEDDGFGVRRNRTRVWEDASTMKVRLIKEIEDLRKQGSDADPAQRKRVLVELAKLKAVKAAETRRRHEEAAEVGVLEVVGRDKDNEVDDDEDEDAQLDVVAAAKQAQAERQAVLAERVAKCNRRQPMQSVRMKGFPLEGVKKRYDVFFHKSNNRNSDNGTGPAIDADRLPTKAELRKEVRYKSCVAVGNSGALFGQALGKFIDSHDVVVRFNQAPTLTYEEHVGRVTSMRVLNRKWTQLYTAKVPKVGSRPLPFEPNATFVSARATVAMFTQLHKTLAYHHPKARVLALNSRMLAYTADLLAAYRECFRRANTQAFSGGNVPTLGLVTVMSLYRACDKVTVVGFGFPPHDANGKPGRFHYFRQAGTEQAAADKGNSIAAEAALLRQLATDGHITLCGKTGCFTNTTMPTVRTAVPTQVAGDEDARESRYSGSA